MSDLFELIQTDIPEVKEKLRESHSNYELVANYCEDNYFKSDDKRGALEVTKNYTTQSLAHVAYLINALAYNLIHMLDLQGTQLAEMESQISHITQTVNIHKEKVARREIGVLTGNKTAYRPHKIIIPANIEKPQKYARRPIDYSLLDNIGHGVKVSNINTLKAKRLSGQNQLNGSVTLRSSNAPNMKPPTPPSTLRGSGSLSRSSKEYRIPAPPVAPPQVPSNYAPNYPIGHPKGPESARRSSGYSTLPVSMAHGGPGGHHISQAMQQMQISKHPSSQASSQQTSQEQHYQRNYNMTMGPSQQQEYLRRAGQSDLYAERHQSQTEDPRIYGPRPTGVVPPSPTPPLPPPPPQDASEPQSHRDSRDLKSGNISPPLPPPPPENMAVANPNPNDWVPKNFIEKVIALYDYVATREDELSFSENSVIYVINKNEDGWNEGVMDGITGLFPGNYCDVLK